MKILKITSSDTYKINQHVYFKCKMPIEQLIIACLSHFKHCSITHAHAKKISTCKGNIKLPGN